MNLYEYFMIMINVAKGEKSIKLLNNIKELMKETPIKLFRESEKNSLNDICMLLDLIDEYIIKLESEN